MLAAVVKVKVKTAMEMAGFSSDKILQQNDQLCVSCKYQSMQEKGARPLYLLVSTMSTATTNSTDRVVQLWSWI